MNKWNVIVFFVFGTLIGVAQKLKTVEITGTVYISSSHAPGVMNGTAQATPQHPFPNQPVYFIKNIDTVVTTTSKEGNFTVKLVPGNYLICQEGQVKNKKGNMSFGTANIEVKVKNEAFIIQMENRSNGRITRSNGTNVKSGTKTTKKTQ